ncbi:hypothetical protein ABI59_09990 [Acidobacteria bacterium Mor1]|nr:hypothetical protein ABI59_09990 [Acidobacteria bacterium Mor1]
MRGLAAFEGYLDEFRVTPADLIEHGLGDTPRFEAYVAQASASSPLAGMAVIYQIPWTYDLRPTLVLKELFVADGARGRGVGKALLRRVASRAAELDCPRVHWTVLENNSAAIRFYRELGARRDTVWQHWLLDAPGIEALQAE